MKLSNEERRMLEDIKQPGAVYSRRVEHTLKRLAALGLCEIAPPMEWQMDDAQLPPVAIAVITPEGRNLLRGAEHLSRSARRRSKMEALNV